MGVAATLRPQIGQARALARRDGACMPFRLRAAARIGLRTDRRRPGSRHSRTAREMLLEADTLIYDNNDETVTASGNVRIDYGGNRLVANRVTYDRRTRRLIASGNVQIVDQDGTTIYSDKIDITDDFGDGFVNALRVETVDKTYFAAESGERRGGLLTTFNNGVYTACEPCEEQPDKAPPWRIKAKKIIWNSKTKTVRFENSPLRVLRPAARQLPGLRDRRPDGQAEVRFPVPGHQLQERPRRRHLDPLLFRAFADLRPDRDRHRLHRAGLPRRGGMAPALQQRRVQRHASPASTRPTRTSSTPTPSIPARPATRTNCAA